MAVVEERMVMILPDVQPLPCPADALFCSVPALRVLNLVQTTQAPELDTVLVYPSSRVAYDVNTILVSPPGDQRRLVEGAEGRGGCQIEDVVARREIRGRVDRGGVERSTRGTFSDVGGGADHCMHA